MSVKICDIHMHILPGIDDGSESMEMSESMLRRAYEQGVRAIFCTSHSYPFPKNLAQARAAHDALCRKVRELELDLLLFFGCEVYCSAYEMDEILPLLASGHFPTMNGTNYVLAEFYPSARQDNILSCAETLLKNGFLPIIAHAERCEYLDVDTVKRLKAMGCRIQVNVYSLYDETKDHIRNFAREMAHEQLIDFLGSDAHRSYHRPPSLTMGIQWLTSNCSPDYVRQITWDNAEKYLIQEKK